jgi:pimeloyl-ACP methyl ester carboxylesterase
MLEETPCCGVATKTKDTFYFLTPKVTASTGKNIKRAVVFIHGFDGSPQETWKCSSGSETFCSLLACDADLCSYAFYVFGYPSGFFGPPAVETVASQLRAMLDAHIAEGKIVLIAHSLGGLVAMKCLLQLLEENYRQRIGGLLLYGCPMTGVEWVNYARVLNAVLAAAGGFWGRIGSFFGKLALANRQLKQLKPGSEFLEELHNQWVMKVVNGGHDALRPDQRAWIPVRIVTGNDDWVVQKSSASALYSTRDWRSVQKDHRALVKPADRTEETYQIAKEFLTECSKWADQETLMGLRKVITTISAMRDKLYFHNFELTVTFKDDVFDKNQSNGFGMPKCVPFELQCSYSRPLSSKFLEIEFPKGRIMFDEPWRDSLVYRHGMFVDTLPSESKKLLDSIVPGPPGSNPEQAWSTLFQNAQIILGPEDDPLLLAVSGTKFAGDRIVRSFQVPEDRLGEDVRISARFTSLLSPHSKGFMLQIPWLTTGFRVTAQVEGDPQYFTSSSSAYGEDLKKETEKGKIKYSTSGLVLPGSSFRFNWAISKPESPKAPTEAKATSA